MKATKTLGWLVMAAVLSFTGCSSDDNTAEEPMPPLGTQTGNIVDLSKLTDDYVAQDSDVLTGTLSGFYKISIAPGATVTLSGATIPGRVADDRNTPWAGITCLGDATIVLADGTENYVRGYHFGYPGIQAGPTGKSKGKNTTLTIRGTGSLTAETGQESDYNYNWGYAAGIGSGINQIVGNIMIEGGTITARGHYFGAGIGCGDSSYGAVSCGDITISGGDITATGGYMAAGIGSGRKVVNPNSCGDIIITGGFIMARGGESAAGIGTGFDASCGNITIGGSSKGIVIGGLYSPYDIGAGVIGKCGKVSIKDGTINSTYPCSFTVKFYQNMPEGYAGTPAYNVNASNLEINSVGRTFTTSGTFNDGSTVTLFMMAIPGDTITISSPDTNYDFTPHVSGLTQKANFSGKLVVPATHKLGEANDLGTVNLVKQ